MSCLVMDIFSGGKKTMPMNEITLDDSERTPCEIWTRVMGYHRPVSEWNRGKQQEHRDRRWFREEQDGWAEPKKQYETDQ
jgi:hypothetical protein